MGIILIFFFAHLTGVDLGIYIKWKEKRKKIIGPFVSLLATAHFLPRIHLRFQDQFNLGWGTD